MITMLASALAGGLAGFVASEALGIPRLAWLLGGIFSLAIYTTATS